MRIFYVLYLEDNIFSKCIDTIRYIANPLEKRLSHITVRGPYSKQISQINSINKKLSGNVVEIVSVGNFFKDSQPTVFFKCRASKLKDVWYKPNYAKYNPHITLYDGPSREFASNLFRTVSAYKYFLQFTGDRLEPLMAAKNQKDFHLPMNFEKDFISGIVGEVVDSDKIVALSDEHRLEIIDKLCRYLSGLS